MRFTFMTWQSFSKLIGFLGVLLMMGCSRSGGQQQATKLELFSLIVPNGWGLVNSDVQRQYIGAAVSSSRLGISTEEGYLTLDIRLFTNTKASEVEGLEGDWLEYNKELFTRAEQHKFTRLREGEIAVWDEEKKEHLPYYVIRGLLVVDDLVFDISYGTYSKAMLNKYEEDLFTTVASLSTLDP